MHFCSQRVFCKWKSLVWDRIHMDTIQCDCLACDKVCCNMFALQKWEIKSWTHCQRPEIHVLLFANKCGHTNIMFLQHQIIPKHQTRLCDISQQKARKHVWRNKYNYCVQICDTTVKKFVHKPKVYKFVLLLVIQNIST